MTRLAGQSMVEFAVALSTLALLLIGTISIAGYQEAQRRTTIAARHAAFDALWSANRGQGRPIAQRLFGDHFDDVPLVDATGRTSLVRSSGVVVRDRHSDAPGRAATATQALLRPLAVAGGFLGGGFDLSARGYRQVEVQTEVVRLGHLPQPFASLDLTLTQPAAILGDAWNAAGSAQVRSRTAGLVPTQSLAAFSNLWRAMAAPLSLLEPSLDRLCLGLIEPETVPVDRLGPSLPALPRPERCR